MLNLTLDEARTRGLTNDLILRDALNALRIIGHDPYQCFDYITKIEDIHVMTADKFRFMINLKINHHGETRYNVTMIYNLAVKGYGNEDLPQLIAFKFYESENL